MLTLRTYALYERSRFVLGLLLVFGLCVISIGMVRSDAFSRS
jgi:hypothetical protein